MHSFSKQCASQFTNSTINKGVEAKEIEIANARLDINETGSSQLEGDSSSRLSAAAAEGERHVEPAQTHHHSPITADDSNSFIQVVVQKHRSKREACAASVQTSPRASTAAPRLPAASSPLHCHNFPQIGETGGMYMMPPPLLLTYPLGTQYSWQNAPRTFVETATSARTNNTQSTRTERARKDAAAAAGGGARAGAGDHALQPKQPVSNKRKKDTLWKKLTNFNEENLNMFENVPERVEVYYLECGGGEYLAARGGAAPTATERLAARAARRATRLLDELLAVPQLLIALPVAILLQVERAVLVAVRGVVVGSVQTVSDYAVKPALATLYNAVVLPPLVVLRQAGAALRAALAPLSGAATDALEPLVRVLGALRLVHVEPHCRCRDHAAAV